MVSLVKLSPERTSGWLEAVRLISAWFSTKERLDRIMEQTSHDLSHTERARCQHLVYGVVRHSLKLEKTLGQFVAHPPRFVTRAILYVAGFEIIDEPAQIAQIVHHAVEHAKDLSSHAEAKLINAVARKMGKSLTELQAPGPIASAENLSMYYSHPEWLVKRWLVMLGAQATRSLLEWNQSPAPVYARWRTGVEAAAQGIPDWLKPTPWENFYEISSGKWSDVEVLLKSGAIYLQDPGTRLSVDLLNPKPGESVLDLCAAPGGKSLQIADRLKTEGLLASWDLPVARIDRLRENLSLAKGLKTEVVVGDILGEGARCLRQENLPTQYDAVLIDVPCSNTGVMRHRIDVRFRLQENDFSKHTRQQLRLLEAASEYVKSGGRLVYSTCSIDKEENEKVVEDFLKKNEAVFVLEKKEISYPWITGHDGAAAFLLRKK